MGPRERSVDEGKGRSTIPVAIGSTSSQSALMRSADSRHGDATDFTASTALIATILSLIKLSALLAFLG